MFSRLRAHLASVGRAGLAAKLYVLLALTYAYFYQGADPNQRTRLFLVKAFVENHTTRISAWHGLTIDKSEFHGEFYCDKAPGLSFLIMPVHAVLRVVDHALGIAADDVIASRVKLHLYVILFCGASGVLATYFLGRCLRAIDISATIATLIQVGYALGTIVFPFSTALFAHQFVAMLVAATFAQLLEMRHVKVWAPRRLFALGVLWGMSIISEYPSAILVACLGLYLLAGGGTWGERGRRLGYACTGALPFLALHAIYMKVAFGGFFELPYKHVFEPFFRVHHDQGLLGVNPPTAEGLYGVTLSTYRGLFFLSPFLILVFGGFADWLQRGDLRKELLLCTVALLGYFLFNTSYYAWDGGGSTGPRHTIPSLIFYVIPIAKLLQHRRRLIAPYVLLLIPSILFMFAAVAVLLHQPEGEVFRSNPLYAIILPALSHGEIALNSQDVLRAGQRAHSAYNMGTLVGLGPLASLSVVPLVWFLAYARGLVNVVALRGRAKS